MICDHIRNAGSYAALAPGITQALDWLARTNLDALAEGRHDIDGDRVFALVSDYETRRPEDAFWEAHRQHVDVQYVHRGAELIACGDLADFDAGPYDEALDLVVARGTPRQRLDMRAGWFAVFFPHDVHMPGLGPAEAGRAASSVRKIVVKVRR